MSIKAWITPFFWGWGDKNLHQDTLIAGSMPFLEVDYGLSWVWRSTLSWNRENTRDQLQVSDDDGEIKDKQKLVTTESHLMRVVINEAIKVPNNQVSYSFNAQIS